MPAIRALFHSVLIPLACLAAASASADQAASRWSLGTQVGWAQGKGESVPPTGDLSTYSLDASATFGDKSRPGWRVFTGYRFTDYLAVHLGYTDLGEYSGDDSTQRIRGTDLGMQLKLPLSGRVAMELRGGKYYWRSRTHGTSLQGEEYGFSRRGSDVFFGAGIEVALLEEITATLGWTRYDIAGEPVHLWTVGTLFRFSM